MGVYSLSGSPVAIEVRIDMTAVVADIPKIVSQSISIIFTASVPIRVTKDWQNVLKALIRAHFQKSFMIITPLLFFQHS